MNERNIMNWTDRMVAKLLLVLMISALSGCGWLKFGSHYEDSEENRPLEIPPDLNAPDTRGEVLVPANPQTGNGGAGNSGSGRSAGANSAEDMPSAGPASAQSNSDQPLSVDELPAGNDRVAWARKGDEVALMVFDQIDSVWRRTGFALERAGFVIDERDEARHLYQVDYQDAPPEEESKGFFGTISGWFSSDDDGEYEDLSGQYKISLIGAGDNTRVMVLDQAGNPVMNRAALNMLALLHERLS